MDSVSTFTKFLLGFVVLIATSLVVTAIIPPDTQQAAVGECLDEDC